jgi:hypothetical protein
MRKAVISAAILAVIITAIFIVGDLRSTTVYSGDSTTPSVSEGPAPSAPSSTPKSTVEPSTIIGQKWSNAITILEDDGVDVNTVSVLTNDGKAVFNPANWTVTSATYTNGKLRVELHHDSDAISDSADKATGKASEYLDKAESSLNSIQ